MNTKTAAATLATLWLTACPATNDANDGDAGSTGNVPTTGTSADTADGATTSPGGSGGNVTSATEGPSASTSATGGATTTPGATGPDINFDLGIIPDFHGMKSGCTKVDFVFVIDNSGSMADEQANLVANFPAFIAGIQSTLTEVSEYQVGVVTTDAYTYNQAVPGCNVLGGLVVQTGGGSSSNSVCGPYANGDNFMTQEDDLPMAFSCAAQVGTSGNGYEKPMEALLDVVNKVNGGPGQCNEGFLRDDALLVVVIITDEADGPGDPEGTTSAGTPMEWYDGVVAAKDGIPENVVVMSLISYNGGMCPPGSAVFDGVNIADFTMMFGANGFVAGVCEPDYGPTFNSAVAIIEDACENFIPPG